MSWLRFGEKDSMRSLHQKGVTRLDIVNFISHDQQSRRPRRQERGEGEGEHEAGGALESYN